MAVQNRKLFWLLFIASFAVVAFGQPAFLPALGWAASFIGYALFWKAAFSIPSKPKLFFTAFLWFTLVQAVQISWLASTRYQGPLIIIVYAFLAIGIGAQFALLTLFIPKKEWKFSSLLGIAGCWVIFEWARLFFISGFNWNPAGMALASHSYSLQWASLFGVYGLSFWVIFINLLGYKALFIARSKKWLCSWLILGILPFLYGFAKEKFYSFSASQGKNLSTLLVQTALLPEEKEPYFSSQGSSFIAPSEQWRRILTYIEKHGKKDIDLIVLPEAALPFGAFHPVYSYDRFLTIWESVFGRDSLDALPDLALPLAIKRDNDSQWILTNAYWAQALSNHFGADVVIGLDDRESINRKNYNAAFHFRPSVHIPSRYEKRMLVPIGEYIPYNWCKSIAHQFGINDSFTPGKNSVIFDGKTKMGISICVEETYSELMRECRNRGAHLFVNITNDVWFPDTILPKQHFLHAALRAVENGIPIIRSTNTGITGAVDALGRVLGTIEHDANGQSMIACALYVKVPLQTHATLYSFWGDAAILSFSLFFLLLLFHDFIIRKKRKYFYDSRQELR